MEDNKNDYDPKFKYMMQTKIIVLAIGIVYILLILFLFFLNLLVSPRTCWWFWFLPGVVLYFIVYIMIHRGIIYKNRDK